MTNEQIHDYLRSKRAVKKFSEFCNVTEQGLFYRLKKGKKSVGEELVRFIKDNYDSNELMLLKMQISRYEFLNGMSKVFERFSSENNDILKGNKNDN